MDTVKKVTNAVSATWDVINRDYYWTMIGLLVLIFIFAIYLYLSPTATEFFTGAPSTMPTPTKKQNT